MLEVNKIETKTDRNERLFNYHMTAIVGIINRNGAAFAADSAATHTLSADNKKKITNHANKVFELSKYHPVGVAICGTLSFMGVPWEDIIKQYRANVEKTDFPHLLDYVQNFMKFVREAILPKFVDEQKGQMRHLCVGLRQEVIDIAVKDLQEKGRDGKSITSLDLFPIICTKLTQFIEDYSKEKMRNGKDFEGYSIEDFTAYARDIISGVLKELTEDDNCPEGFKDLFAEALYNILLSRNHVYFPTTELIFWGYGEDDLFPSCHSILISSAFNGRIRWTDQTDFVVSNSSPAWIIPYAQTDVANTVVRGVDQNLRDHFSGKANEVLNKFKMDLVQKLDEVNAPDDLKKAIAGLDTNPYTALFTGDMNDYIQENYIDKLMDTVSYLMKEDLADMAESLVRMTCLKRHFTTDEETVGGPVDVAVATRGDGFAWIKRKHYFSPDINHHYFER